MEKYNDEVNPYNFVPLDRGIIRRAMDTPPFHEGLTGYLECTLKPLAPIFIPNTSCDDALHNIKERRNTKSDNKGDKICSYDFFSYKNLADGYEKNEHGQAKPSVPVIPATEIRGCIRSVYEAAFNGCLSSINETAPLEEVGKGRKDRGKQVVDVLGEHAPCMCRKKLCPTCALFGMVSKKGNSVGTRIRFTDALVSEECRRKVHNPEEYYYSPVVLPALASPHSEKYRLYTLNFNDKGGKNRESGNGKAVGLMLRGRKFYWHSDVWEKHKKGRNCLSNTTQRIRPLRSTFEDETAITFRFVVHFENILKSELSQLIWTLDFNEKRALAHKIGRAKPLGFGSAEITVDKLYLRQIDDETGAWSLQNCGKNELEDMQKAIVETKSLSTLKLMLNRKGIPKKKVKYISAKKNLPLPEQEVRSSDMS